jgi:two-component system LytT family response regulator
VFFRIHRSTIVNLNRIRGLKLNEDGEYTVLLESGTSLRMSRRYRRPLQDRLGLRLSHTTT